MVSSGKIDFQTGSSPQMRGAQSADQAQLYRLRIIPADAGSTLRSPEARAILQDHPRGCREHCVEDEIDGLAAGSSPRMRGAPYYTRVGVRTGRIIPADAGSTFFCSILWLLEFNHPRGCGEQVSPVCRSLRNGGSSPRMRGAPQEHGLSVLPLWIIPADAGSTL